jgi:hypothetical protein
MGGHHRDLGQHTPETPRLQALRGQGRDRVITVDRRGIAALAEAVIANLA